MLNSLLWQKEFYNCVGTFSTREIFDIEKKNCLPENFEKISDS